MRSHPGDAGESLVEILAAITILGIGIAGLMTALGTHAATTVVNRDQSQASTALLSAAEHVKSLSFAACGPASATTVTSAKVPRAAGLTVTYGPGRALTGTPCSSLTIVPVTVTGNGFTLSVDVVKRP
jgi:type II secretory pathway pseudopilin PulG